MASSSFAKFKTLIIFQVMMRPMFGAFGKAGSAHSIAFVSKVWISVSPHFLSPSLYFLVTNFFFLFFPYKQAALDNGIKALYGLNKRVEAVGNVTRLTKLDMKLNDALLNITVDPETYTVKADGEVLTCTAATTVPLSRNYFLF